MPCSECRRLRDEILIKLRLDKHRLQQLGVDQEQLFAFDCPAGCFGSSPKIVERLCLALSGRPATVACNHGGILNITPHWWLLCFKNATGPLLTAPHGNIAAGDWPASAVSDGCPPGDAGTWEIALGTAQLLKTPALRGALPRYLVDYNRAFDGYEQRPGGRAPALSYHLTLNEARRRSDGLLRPVLDLHGFSQGAAADVVIAWEGPEGLTLACSISAQFEEAGLSTLLQGRDRLPAGLRGNYTLRHYGASGAAVQLELSMTVRSEPAACASLLASAWRLANNEAAAALTQGSFP